MPCIRLCWRQQSKQPSALAHWGESKVLDGKLGWRGRPELERCCFAAVGMPQKVGVEKAVLVLGRLTTCDLSNSPSTTAMLRPCIGV